MYVHDLEPELEPEPEPEPYSDNMSEPEPSSNFPVPQPCWIGMMMRIQITLEGVLSQPAELVLYYEIEELPEIKDELEGPAGAGEPQPGPSKPRMPREGFSERPTKRVCRSCQEDEEEDGKMDKAGSREAE